MRGPAAPTGLAARVLTGAVGIPLMLGLVWAGGWYFAALCAVLALLASLEYAALWRSAQLTVDRALLAAVNVLLVGAAGAGVAYLPAGEGAGYLPAAFSAAVLVSLAHFVLCHRRLAVPAVAVTLGGVVYIGWLLAHWVLLRGPGGPVWPPAADAGLMRLLFAMLCTWATDTAAYFGGRAWGRRRLAPQLSPAKSVEGLLSGSAASAAVGALLAPAAGWAVPVGAALGLLVALVGHVGDLVESALKRHAGVKDAGTLLPGHGGVLDRFDSLLLNVILVYYLGGLVG